MAAIVLKVSPSKFSLISTTFACLRLAWPVMGSIRSSNTPSWSLLRQKPITRFTSSGKAVTSFLVGPNPAQGSPRPDRRGAPGAFLIAHLYPIGEYEKNQIVFIQFQVVTPIRVHLGSPPEFRRNPL